MCLVMIGNWAKLALLLGVLGTQVPAHAFFDDFLGDRLADNWGTGWLEYHVADSNFTVTKETAPGGESPFGLLQSATGYGFDYFAADFSASVKVSFTPGTQLFLWTLGNFFNSGYGYMQFQLFGYEDARYATFLLAGGSESSETFRIDPHGSHEFRIDRRSLRIRAFLDNALIFESQNAEWYGGQDLVTLSYAGDFESAPFSADYVSIETVPEPCAALLLAGAATALSLKRKKLSSTRK